MEQAANYRAIGGRYHTHKDKQPAGKVSNGSHQRSGRCFGLAYMALTFSTRSEMSRILIIGVFKLSFV
jgi:hypothetical protein